MDKPKFAFRKLAVAIVMATTIGTSTAPVHASGFPVVDIASIAQAVADYSNQLLQYTEQMQQTTLEESQLAQLIATYEQTMTSYNHMLTQMNSLKNMMDKRDWSALYSKYASVIDSYPGNMTDFNAGKWIAKDKELKSLYQRIDRAKDLEDAIRAIPFNADSEEAATVASEQAYAREQLAVGQSLFVDDMTDELQVQMERYGEVATKRAALGPEDHLKTLQVMAEQNELIIEAAQQQNAINNANLQYSNQLDAHVFALQNQGRQAGLKSTKAQLSATIEVDNTKLSDY